LGLLSWLQGKRERAGSRSIYRQDTIRDSRFAAGLIVNWQRPKGQNIARKVAFNSSGCQKSGKNIILAVIVVVVGQKREGGFPWYL
jgi:hypothetical protein